VKDIIGEEKEIEKLEKENDELVKNSSKFSYKI